MKFCFFVVLVCIQTALPALAQGQSIRERINEYIQNLKNRIPEPVELSDVDVVVPENEYFEGKINVANRTLGGLRDFSVDVNYSGIIIPIPTGFTLTIDNLDSFFKLLSSLEVYEPLIDYDLVSNFRTVTTDFVAKVKINFTAIPLSVSVTSIWYNIGGIEFDIQGIISDRYSRVLSTILSNTVANVLNAFQEPISEILVDVINSILGNAANEVNISNPYSVHATGSQEKAVENLGKFFEILENRFGLRS